jgi:transposase InsO family protein
VIALLRQTVSAREFYIKKIISKEMKQREVQEILGVSAVTLRKWRSRYLQFGSEGLLPRKRGPKPGSVPHNKTPEAREEKVLVLAQENPFAGPVELSEKLREESICLDQSTVYRILRRKKKRYGREYKTEKKKWKLYSLDRTGRELQLDASFPFGYQRKECIYSIIDDCSRFVFSRVMPAHNEENSIAFVELFLQRFSFRVEAIRTDCGREFSTRFSAFLSEQTIEHRKNRPYCPEHNGKVERYNRTRKENCMLPFYGSLDECNYLLQQWEQYYNYHRKHTGLSMNKMTPVQKILYSLISSSLEEKRERKSVQQYKI